MTGVAAGSARVVAEKLISTAFEWGRPAKVRKVRQVRQQDCLKYLFTDSLLGLLSTRSDSYTLFNVFMHSIGMATLMRMNCLHLEVEM